MADKVKEVAVEEAERIKSLTSQAARSGAYLYPLRGIAYFLTHRSLWKPFQSRLVPTLTMGLGITGAMFFLTYLPQMAVMAFTQGPLAAVSAALLVLSESSALTNALARSLLVADALTDTFDGTLVARGRSELVASGRQVGPAGAGADPVARLGRLVKRPLARLAPRALLRYLVRLPLNFIPVVGTLVFIVAQGKSAGPVAHARYFQLRGWSRPEREKHVARYEAAYTSFGVVSVLLELIPVASIFFSFTSAVGAALWAADMEEAFAREHGTSPELRETAKKAQ